MRTCYDCQYAKRYDNKTKTWRDGIIRAEFLGGCVKVSLYENENYDEIGVGSLDTADVFNVSHNELQGREVFCTKYVVKVESVRREKSNNASDPLVVKRHIVNADGNANGNGQPRLLALGTGRRFKRFKLDTAAITNGAKQNTAATPTPAVATPGSSDNTTRSCASTIQVTNNDSRTGKIDLVGFPLETPIGRRGGGHANGEQVEQHVDVDDVTTTEGTSTPESSKSILTSQSQFGDADVFSCLLSTIEQIEQGNN